MRKIPSPYEKINQGITEVLLPDSKAVIESPLLCIEILTADLASRDDGRFETVYGFNSGFM